MIFSGSGKPPRPIVLFVGLPVGHGLPVRAAALTLWQRPSCTRREQRHLMGSIAGDER
jgi:hypothetical protein